MIQKFEFCNTDFEGAYLIKPFCATDIRGAFIKDYSKEVFEANGLEHNLAEVFYTVSHKGVIRALHFQRVHEQAKLVRRLPFINIQPFRHRGIIYRYMTKKG